MKIFLGKQHYIENFDYNSFIKDYNTKPYTAQRAFIDSFDISTNPEWLKCKRGHLGASTASKFLSSSQKVAGLKRTKKFMEATIEEQRSMLADIPVEERLGDTCKDLAFRVIAERNTSWVEEQESWSEKSSIKRGLVFEQFSTQLYEMTTGNQTQDILFVERDDLMGFSPDKLVLEEGKRVCLEIKNFEPPAYYKAVCDIEKPETIAQVQMQIYSGDLDRVDVLYCSFEDKSFKLVKYFRDEEYMKQFALREQEFKQFLEIVEKQIKNQVINIGG